MEGFVPEKLKKEDSDDPADSKRQKGKMLELWV